MSQVARSETWQQMLDRWPQNAYHFMEDMPFPVKLEGNENWERVVPLSHVPFCLWTDNLTAEGLLREMGRSNIAVSWQSQYLEETQRRYVKQEGPLVEWTVLSICEDWVISFTSPFKEIVERYPQMFASKQLQTCRILSGLPLGSMRSTPTYSPPEKRQENYVFFVTVGPSVENVKSVEGRRSSVMYSTQDQWAVWHVCSAPCSSKNLEVPLELKVTWLRMQFVTHVEQDFLSQAYYATSMDAYSMWSFALHQQQVLQVLQMISLDATLVVPGDGIGVVSTLWKGAIISGDLFSSRFTSRSVKQETFLQTMVRGKGAGRVLILSYVYSLMTVEEKRMVSLWEGPLFIIDSKDSSPFPFLTHLGPGVYGSLPGARSTPFTAVEKNTAMQSVQYSENLLRFPSIRSETMSPSVQYWRGMRPFGNWSDPTGQLIIHDLQELLQVQGQGIDVHDAYLASTGMKVNDPLDIALDAVSKIYSRKIYRISIDHELVPFLKRKAQYAVSGKVMLFVTLTEISWSFKIDTSTVKSKGTIYTSESEMPSYQLLGHHDSDILVQTPSGIRVWSMAQSFHRWMVVSYFTVFGDAGWQSLLSDDPVVRLDPTSFVGEIFDPKVTAALDVKGYQALEGISPLSWKTQEGSSLFEKFVLGNKEKRRNRRRYFERMVRFGDAMDLPPPLFQ